MLAQFQEKKQKAEEEGADFDEDEIDHGILSAQMFNLKCEWENIHNKVIFDAINEALDGYRPYGLKGPPLPWSKQTRTLTNKNQHI